MSKKDLSTVIVENDYLEIDGIKLVQAKDIESYEQAKNISLKEVGSSVEGYLLGYVNQLGEQDNILTIVYLYDLNLKSKVTFVAGYQVKNFLENTGFKSGYWLKVTKIGESETKKGMQLSQFKIEYDKKGCSFKDLIFNRFDEIEKKQLTDSKIEKIDSELSL